MGLPIVSKVPKRAKPIDLWLVNFPDLGETHKLVYAIIQKPLIEAIRIDIDAGIVNITANPSELLVKSKCLRALNRSGVGEPQPVPIEQLGSGFEDHFRFRKQN